MLNANNQSTCDKCPKYSGGKCFGKQGAPDLRDAKAPTCFAHDIQNGAAQIAQSLGAFSPFVSGMLGVNLESLTAPAKEYVIGSDGQKKEKKK